MTAGRDDGRQRARAFRLIREAASSLVNRRGAVVNVSSAAGRAPSGVASRREQGAVDQLTRVAALISPRCVRVNAVIPASS